MNVESLAFWQQVKSEYKPDFDPLICVSSLTFEEAWEGKQNKEIRELAYDYINNNNTIVTGIGTHYLFYGGVHEKSYQSIFEKIKIRQDFINWCIERFSI